MTMAFRLLLRVIKRRVARGEVLEAVLADYPGMTEEERANIIEAF